MFWLAINTLRTVVWCIVRIKDNSQAVTLGIQIKTAFEVSAVELVELVEGNPKKTNSLKQKLTEIFENALSEYAKEMDIEIIIENEEINEPIIIDTETRGAEE